MAQQSSRLHRLLTLLDTGSTQATRFAAARQIGDIAKSLPQDLSPLLKKVSQYLCSKNWDTRVAAAHAIGAIAANVKHTSLKELFNSVEVELVEAGLSDVSKEIGKTFSDVCPAISGGLSFKSFDINKVLEFGSPLLASGGQEYDVASDVSKSPAERLARQKQNLRRRLGLDVCEQFMDVSDVIRDEDLLAPKGSFGGNGPNNGYYGPRTGQNFQQLMATMVPNVRPRKLSAREMNLLKRRARVGIKDQVKGTSADDDVSMPNTQNSEIPKGMLLDASSACKDFPDAVTDDDNSEIDDSGRWPFEHFIEQLVHDMFDPVWEVRHGSIMALREILTHHGSSVGVYSPEVSLEVSSLVDSDEKPFIDSEKRGREIDLNTQLDIDDFQSDKKRHKIATGYSDKQVNDPCFLRMEQCASSTIMTHINGDVDMPQVKVEADAFTEGFNNQLHTEDTSPLKTIFDEGSSTLKMKLPANLPESSKITKLVKLARSSWTKNWGILQDCAIRCICVLSLDRFGDYVSDQVVAPVRETCAQALGALLKYMHPSLVYDTLKILLQMQCRQEWEIRHGSLLGIKYLVAVRPEMLQNLLFYVLPACKAGLEDPDDDVRAVAAEALIPTASSVVSLNDQVLHSVIMLLWDILLDLDDLSPSTSSVMNLLAEIYSQPEMVSKMLDNLKLVGKKEIDLNEVSQAEEPGDQSIYKENPYMLSALTPRLWPFMRHNISSVRYSAIRTLERLLEVGSSRSSCEPMTTDFWPSFTLSDALRIIFQNLLLESNDDILRSSERVWRLLLQCPEQDLEATIRLYFVSWVQLATTPYGSPLDATAMYWPVALPCKSRFRAVAKMRALMHENDSDKNLTFGSVKETSLEDKKFDVSANMSKIIVGADSEKSVTHTRVTTAIALGILASKLPENNLPIIIDSLWNALVSSSGVKRQFASMVLMAWLKELKNRDPAVYQTVCYNLGHVKQWLLDLLSCSDPSFPTKDCVLPYAELSRTYIKMRSEATLLLQAMISVDIFKDHVSNINLNPDSLNVDEAIIFGSKVALLLDSADGKSLEKQLIDDLEALRQRLLSTSGYLKCVQNNLHIAVSSSVAASVVWMSELPSKLNPVILPLMAAIKREQEEILQQKAAEALSELIFYCIGRKPSPNDKLIRNLCSLTCSDTYETPQAAIINSMEVIEDQNLLSLAKTASIQKSKLQTASVSEDKSKGEGFISRRGSEMVLKYLCDKFGSSVFDKLPRLWECLTEALKPISSMDLLLAEYKTMLQMTNISQEINPQTLINNIQVVRSISPVLDESLRSQLLTLLPSILSCVCHCHVAVRLAASRCITTMAKSMTMIVMGPVIEKVIPMLSDTESGHARQGAGMLLTLLVQGLGVELVPYAPFLVVPLLKCMNDCDHAVRQTVTHSFAALVPLLPLARGVPAPAGLCERLSNNTEDAQFLDQLLDNSSIDDYKLPIDLKVELRRYQQEGINWLAFLKRFKLHGILCDDMGLGKTLQASAVVASDIIDHRVCNDAKEPRSLIVCPSTLVGHWAYEIEKYIDSSVITTLQYVGSIQLRSSLHDQFDRCNVVITSYDVVRKDIEYLGKLSWNYCILDEGHVIKNSKSKITAAVKQLKAEHRLILSGTPIQNNALELWSLFDFLMPGFLGTEKQFQNTYGKPLMVAKDPKCSAKDAEAGILAMEALHKQVMPFLLRRTKDEVLSDLPEKIIQDRYCDLSPLQVKLYERFAFSNVKREISTLVNEHDAISPAGETTAPKATTHVFQAIKYLLKLCSHPLLVIGDKPPDSLMSLVAETVPNCADILSELRKIQYSPKLVALQEILEECRIGLDPSSYEDNMVVGQHRVLIFAQHKSFLDVIERDLFQTHMKSVTYLRLDGSVEPEKRFDVVKAFNSDPTIDVLLLTTHVGGLGLNLTSADTLVFMEHDWNPMKDLQAMDRAHRLGQRKVVNVHRLIMRGTLEEKVMSLQKFKVSVANTVINAENASMKTMNTDQLLDLFTSAPTCQMGATVSSRQGDKVDKEASTMAGGKGLKSLLNGLDKLWDESQYADEFNVGHFVSKLNG